MDNPNPGQLYTPIAQINNSGVGLSAPETLLAQAGVGGALQAASSGESHNTGHSREEWRRCWAFDAGDRLYKGDQWRELQSFALVERTRRIVDRTSVERRYYISSLAPDAEKFMRAVRSHWEVENRLHWCLDVQLGDDYARARASHVAHNLALVRHIALPLTLLNIYETSIMAQADAGNHLRCVPL